MRIEKSSPLIIIYWGKKQQQQKLILQSFGQKMKKGESKIKKSFLLFT